MKPTNHSSISEKNQRAQESSHLQALPTPCDNDNMPKGHLSFPKRVSDHRANESKKRRARVNLDSIVLVDEKTDKSALVRWFFFSFPEHLLTPTTEL